MIKEEEEEEKKAWIKSKSFSEHWTCLLSKALSQVKAFLSAAYNKLIKNVSTV